MPSDQHRALTRLVRKLAKEGKYLSIKVYDERPDLFDDAQLINAKDFDEGVCCKRWGYDPQTGKRYCIEPC